MGCSNDQSVQVDNEETNQIPEEDNLIEKEFPDFEEYNSKWNYII